MRLTTCGGWHVYSLLFMVFPVVMYGCESGTVKKAEHQRIDAFEPWYWRKLLSLTINRTGVHGDKSAREYEKAVFA